MSRYLLCLATTLTLGQTQFTEVTETAGLSFTHGSILDHIGWDMEGGGAVGDFNRDGWPDLYVMGGGLNPDRLFINNGDGTFSDQAVAWGLTTLHRGVGAAVGDFDGDGWQDLFVASLGSVAQVAAPGHHLLLRNLSGIGFVDVADAAGVAWTAPVMADGFGAAWGDYDLDGDLDLFVCGWHEESAGNVLFRNLGDGTFEDVTVAAGVFNLSVHGFSPRFADMNGDDWPELLISADFGTSRYYANDGAGGFIDMTPFSGCGLDTNGMGGAVGDFDGNGMLDWHVTSIFHDDSKGNNGNFLYVNQGEHLFQPVGYESGLRDGGWAWGTDALDFDHDGLLDLAVTNGWRRDSFSNEQAYLFHNEGDLTFTDVALQVGLVHNGQGRGLVTWDYDRDGDRDIVIFESAGPLTAFRNDLVAPDRHWLTLLPVTDHHPDLAPNGLGTKFTVTAGGQTWYTQLTGGSTYLGNSQYQSHIGLGTVASIDQLTVRWADGSEQVHDQIPMDSELIIYAPHHSLLPILCPGWNSQMPTCLGSQLDVRDMLGFINDGYLCPPMIHD